MTPINILSMYAGTPRPLGARALPSAILKSSIPGPWDITQTGLVGDVQAELVHHGGPDKAVHHYPRALCCMAFRKPGARTSA